MCGLLPIKDRTHVLVAVGGESCLNPGGSRHTSRRVAVGENPWRLGPRLFFGQRLRFGFLGIEASPPDSKEKM